MAVAIDLTGKSFGTFTVIDWGPNNKGTVRWNCVCSCGEIRLVGSQDLRVGHTKSCGILDNHPDRKKICVPMRPEFRAWKSMIYRCSNPRCKEFNCYGGRGVSVCQEWIESFENFFEHIGSRPSPRHSVDRIDVNGNYAPGNVRWATSREQNNNRRNTRTVFYQGELRPLAETVRLAGSVIHIEAAHIRLKWGWNTERVLETPRLHESGHSKAKQKASSNRGALWAATR